jgi:hypothetical protein
MVDRENARLVVYSREGCGLCDEMIAELATWLAGRSLSAEVRDVDSDPGLRERYGLKVPVLAVDGQPVCSGRLDTELLEDLLRS